MNPIRRMILRRIDQDDARSLSVRLRTRRIQPLIELIEGVHAERGRVSIIDVGGTVAYWRIVPREILERNNVTITIVNLPGMVPDEGDEPHDPMFVHRVGDGCDLSAWADDAFDIAHSNSVVEHVGDWDAMCRFASEVRRVARAGFTQTPNFWFPVEPHCMTPLFHWLPKSWRLALVMRFNLGNWRRQTDVDRAMRTVESSRLLDRRMFEQLFGADARIRTERFMGLPKSLVAVRPPAPAPVGSTRD